MKKASFLFALILATGLSSHAISIDWAGKYRAEYTNISNTSLGSPNLAKEYITQGLFLEPKIIAADGVNINARFDIFTNPNYPNSQEGMLFGSGVSKNSTAVTNAQANGSVPASSTGADSNVYSNNQASGSLLVSQLYLTYTQEYGELVVGRIPVQFGLGITHNAGLGDFDHWYELHDVIGYKVILGNLSIMPMVGKAYQQSPSEGNQVNDLMLDVEYNNPETKSQIGIFDETRKSSTGSNDAPTNYIAPGGTPAQDVWTEQDINIFFGRGFDEFDFKLEVGFQTGYTGVLDMVGEEVKISTYGAAAEFGYQKTNSPWKWKTYMGLASGDNPNTNATYEGFQFNKNYDVALLLFNHPLGRYDLFRTGIVRTPQRCAAPPCSVYPTDQAVDDEAISNVYYLSQHADWKFSDKWSALGAVTYALLQTSPVANVNVDKSVGVELDGGVNFRPNDKILWQNELGLLFPGGAFSGGQGFPQGFTYGLFSRASISF